MAQVRNIYYYCVYYILYSQAMSVLYVHIIYILLYTHSYILLYYFTHISTGTPETVFVERKTHRESWAGEVSVKERFVIPEKQVQSLIGKSSVCRVCMRLGVELLGAV